jgi:hypothetical protein
MKATLDFNLPDEFEEFKMTCRATDYYCMIEKILNYLRTLDKYETYRQDDTTYKDSYKDVPTAISTIREEINNIAILD